MLVRGRTEWNAFGGVAWLRWRLGLEVEVGVVGRRGVGCSGVLALRLVLASKPAQATLREEILVADIDIGPEIVKMKEMVMGGSILNQA